MTKYEAFRSGKFERVEFTSVGTTSSGKRWAQGVIAYRRASYELTITEDFQLDLGLATLDATAALVTIAGMTADQAEGDARRVAADALEWTWSHALQRYVPPEPA